MRVSLPTHPYTLRISLLISIGYPEVSYWDLREWRNGRRAGFRCQCPQGRAGSSPASRTKTILTKPGDGGVVNLDTFVLTLEAIGVIAFAISGFIEAARKHFDFVGVVMISFIAAFGGGTLRDLILDRRPFFWVEQEFWIWALIGIGVAAPFFVKAAHIEFTEKAMLIPDAFGLGIFAAGGTHIALVSGATPMVAVIMGVITAVFGGVLRDVLVNEVPRAFHDHQPYAVIAFAGGWLVVLLGYLRTPEFLDILIPAVLMIILRLLSVKFGWELKRGKFL